MKKCLLFVLMICVVTVTSGQLEAKVICSAFTVDLLDGIVNGVRPDLHPDKIKEKLPCFTSAENEGPNAKCGGIISYKDRDIYFYTQRDYVEIGPKFKGKLSLPLMGAKRNSLFKWLGNPKLKDPDWDAYQTQYGCIVMYFTKTGVVNKIQFSTKQTETLQLCQ